MPRVTSGQQSRSNGGWYTGYVGEENSSSFSPRRGSPQSYGQTGGWYSGYYGDTQSPQQQRGSPGPRAQDSPSYRPVSPRYAGSPRASRNDGGGAPVGSPATPDLPPGPDYGTPPYGYGTLADEPFDTPPRNLTANFDEVEQPDSYGRADSSPGVVAYAAPTFFDGMENEIFEALNKARTEPASFISNIETKLQYYDRKAGQFFMPGENVGRIANEGDRSFREAIVFLRRQKPLPPLVPYLGMTLASRDHARDLGASNATGHIGSDGSTVKTRIERYGAWEGTCGENVDYEQDKSGEDIVMALIVDDGVPDRGHRSAIFDPSFAAVGIGYADHPTMEKVYAMAFAGSYRDD